MDGFANINGVDIFCHICGEATKLEDSVNGFWIHSCGRCFIVWYTRHGDEWKRQ